MHDVFSILSPRETRVQLKDLPAGSLVDVRTPAEFREVHTDVAVNRPLDQLDPNTFEFPNDDKQIYVICRSGQLEAFLVWRSPKGRPECEALRDAGIDGLFPRAYAYGWPWRSSV